MEFAYQTGNKSGKIWRPTIPLDPDFTLLFCGKESGKYGRLSKEPLLPEDRQELEDLATDLVAKANTLAGRLHPVMRASVGDLVRSMKPYRRPQHAAHRY